MPTHLESRPPIFPYLAPHSSSSATIGRFARLYDYTEKYNADKSGEEIHENARVWNVYLDEAESYDADVMQGFRNIIDGLLVFASLFSAVVTTFVAQTSQALQPDNGQIIVALLVENNQLLRAAGNITTVNSVPRAPLSPGSFTYTSIDVWVNGFFFISLALALVTALITVLAKQWIQAYTTIVPGGAKTRALIRQFRFQGLVKWRLGDIIESLPLILHSSVALFLIGLVLHVSQLSFPLCGIVAAVTALAFLFYLGTSTLPVVFIDCPYRVPFIFPLVQFVLCVIRTAKPGCKLLLMWLQSGCKKVPPIQWPIGSRKSLKTVEYDSVFHSNHSDSGMICGSKPYWDHYRFTCGALYWVLNHSSDQSVKQIVFEAVAGLLCQLKNDLSTNSPHDSTPVLGHDLFSYATIFSLRMLWQSSKPSFAIEDDVTQDRWGRLLQDIFEISSPKSFLDLAPRQSVLQGQIVTEFAKSIDIAIVTGKYVLLRHLLHWCNLKPSILQSTYLISDRILLQCLAILGQSEDICSILNEEINIHQYTSETGDTLLHLAARNGNLAAVIAFLEKEPSLIHLQTHPPTPRTVLEYAIESGYPDVVAYLLDNGADRSPHALHMAVHSKNLEQGSSLVKVLLDGGCDRMVEDANGRTPLDVAKAVDGDSGGSLHETIEYLEHYQTARTRPNGH